MRKNPLIWDDVEPAEGVLAPFEGVDEGGEGLSLLGLPSGRGLAGIGAMRADAEPSPAVYAFLTRVRDALQTAAETGAAWRARIDGLSAEDQSALLDALGQGEVSMVVAGGAGEGDAQIAETVLPGVWTGRAEDASGVSAAAWIEVGDAPRVLREVAATRPRGDLAIEALSAPRGAMNVMSVLTEIRERARDWRPGGANHVMNFTLFPMTPADSAFLSKVLGEAGAQISSGGYGAARVILTGLRHVWAVQYLNGLGAVILDTIEIGDVPASVLAAREDFEDSAGRLADIMEAYAP